MGSVKESPRGKGVSSKKSRPSATASAPSTGMNLTTAPSTSIHAIASATATGTRGGITAVTANMSPPSANLSPVSVTSPTSSATSPTSSSSTSSKKKSGQASKKAGAGVPAGTDNVPSKFPKPTQSYSFLITTAILESSNSQLTLNEIYEWVMLHYPWYRTAINGWKNSIRHNLSLNKAFMRVPRPPSEPGKGSYWKLDPNYQPNADGHSGTGHSAGGLVGASGGTARPTKTSRRASATRGAGGSSGRRPTSDPNSAPVSPTGPSAQPGILEIPLTNMPLFGKRGGGGADADSSLFKIGAHSASMIPGSSNSSSATASMNRRHSHLLSHDHDYTTPGQQPNYGAAHMSPSFNLGGLSSQQQQQQQQQQPHHNSFFSSVSGSAQTGDFGQSASFYANGTGQSAAGLSDSSMMDADSDSTSLSRFSGQGIYLSQGAGGASTLSRPLSMGSHGMQSNFVSAYGGNGGSGGGGNNSHSGHHGGAGGGGGGSGSYNSNYGAGASHAYGGMGGGAGAAFHAGSANYGFPPVNRTSGGGGGGGGGAGGGSGGNGYRASVDGGAGSRSSTSIAGLSLQLSQSLVSTPAGMGSGGSETMSPPPPPPQSLASHHSGSNPVGGAPSTSSAAAANSGVGSASRPTSSSITIPQESRNSSNGAGGGGHGW
ncbi:Forkhead box protein J2 [Mortierella sp. GBA39]|nr:Forkhead box protein J2 [Mortierella sp. GBA39]